MTVKNNEKRTSFLESKAIMLHDCKLTVNLTYPAFLLHTQIWCCYVIVMLVNDANYLKIKHGVLRDMVFITSEWRSFQLSLRVAQPFMIPSHAFHIFPGVVLFFMLILLVEISNIKN